MARKNKADQSYEERDLDTPRANNAEGAEMNDNADNKRDNSNRRNKRGRKANRNQRGRNS